MNVDGSARDGSHVRPPPPLRGHLAAVAADFLPLPSVQLDPARETTVPVFFGAPGDADTAAAMAALVATSDGGATHDLGARLRTRLGVWERKRRPVAEDRVGPLLFWCLVDREGPSLGSALALGRIGALLQPRRVTLLWFSGRIPPPGRCPEQQQRDRTLALARAAVPGVGVSLHCIGWLGEPQRELSELARRFA